MATHEQRNTRVPGYVLLQKLCKGRQAKVYKAQALQTHEGGACGDEVAVKMFRGPDSMASLQREVRFLTTVQGHPNIVRTVESIAERANVQALVLELCDKDLCTLTSERVFTVAGAADIMQHGVLSALQHIHKLRIVHRDIKPDNIAVGWDGAARVMDFGISAWMFDDIEMHRKCGSPGYMAPEIIDQRMYGPPVDIFAFGSTLYFMLSNQHPFETDSGTVESIFAKTKLCIISFGINFDHVGNDTRKFISWCMHEDAKWRPTASDALACPPFASCTLGEDDRRPMSFEEQLAARSEVELQSPTRALPRERPVRPTPLVKLESAVHPSEKTGTADFPTPPVPRRESVLPQILADAPLQPPNEPKACNMLGSVKCEHVRKHVFDSAGKSQEATSVGLCGKESSIRRLIRTSHSSLTRDTLEGLPFLGEFARSFDMLPELEPDI
eukprot:TRINITY_DN5036_c0_g3_i1.p1 TRINITY_DN5036_c0_g3~~TRINITY_DN5036_c0_g3_i1.p1  ORF type:complete len:442 (+),score=41.81 TRINITY_DN5036_c0_g3_i1:19-1344(+)